ncbi:cysteine/glutathione ABC transporter permease/ATP-binding protein CydD [Sansalvadorimonas sp. 2012CJ34-2]|uniref:Cysteine/glutathione ABC transporter permease/ATP-binding protein CydD n=1 Tax=Parendozoicomonas callyspongiae TaxID=2942213 RepID=A0ABT0PJM6_9GAMM|nr:cysteine/glutathione ABC transporter permease/ATP-binding protein CydD [Sansalvadorimonas sp. 2012CJ34-2]MCL6271587.1 cysteine/glutathione ABC transporter permease/ATP-binding protein CydD [Sansalvadorimonas sp. 2012CJ34-2]
MQKEREQVLQSWLRSHQVSVKSFIRCAVILGVGQYFLVVLQAALLAWIIDQAVMSGVAYSQLTWPFITLIVAGILRGLCARGRELAGHQAGENLRRKMRGEILEKISELGPVVLAERPSGSWLTLLMEQVDKLNNFYSHYLPQMILVRILPLFTIALVLPFSWAVAVILLVTAPLIVVFMILVGNRAAAASRRNVQALSRLSAHFLDRLQGLATLRLFYRSAQERASVASAAESFRQKTMQVLRLAFLSSTVLEFFTAIAIALTAMYLGMSYLSYLDFGTWGEPLSLFTGLFLLLLAPEYYLPLRELGTHYHAKADAVGAADDLEAFLEQPREVFTGGEEQCPDEAAATVSFRNVSVVAESGRQLLKDISFDINAGERLAIVGLSGAGKTTLINVLLGFIPYEGEVLVNGISLRELDLASWRQNIAWLGQNPRLFSGSIRENILLADPHASEEVVNRVVSQAHIDEFVGRLGNGLDTRVGDDAAGLSVGQAQRVALARALIRPFQLLVLDEPTASLDQHSAGIVNRALDKAVEGRTMITVSHRQDSLIKADRIIMLDNGCITAQGNQEKLWQESSRFQQLWQSWQEEEQAINSSEIGEVACV